MVLSLWREGGDNTVVARAEQSCHRREASSELGVCGYRRLHFHAGAFRLAWVLLLEERPGSVGMDGCSHVARDGVGGPGGHRSIVCSRVQIAGGCSAWGLPDGHVLGAGHAVWTCLESQPLAGML